ncbi:alpha/beta hydrolase fold domain-containing protein [Dactylosporangium sp. NPDC049525]|uniref:alpha/beta hydrolase family protein n=1 Tax=Dactylosporangium sp. NPDC049525 TaxID=3154730 RepID=UPI00341DC2CC
MSTPRAVTYRSAAGTALTADLRHPGGPEPVPVVVLAHGGAWKMGARGDYDGWARVLTAAGFATLSVDYTLATDDTPSWPAAADDVAAAFRLLWTQRDRLGVDPARTGCLGTSAGAHLLATAALTQDTGCQAAVLVNGVYDLRPQHAYSATRPFNAVELLMGGPPSALGARYAAASPVRLAAGSGLAAGIAWTIVYGERDPVVPPLEQSGGFAAALSAAGADVTLVGVPEATHFWNTAVAVDAWPNTAIRDLVVNRLTAALAPVAPGPTEVAP